ncbi:MAG: DUF5011 domain-containing protein [Bacilli bacterium]
MKNKGFTLVELLAILGILAVITLITIPVIDGLVKKNKEKMFGIQMETIKEAAKNWVTDNTELIDPTEGATLNVNIGLLKFFGYLPVDIKSAKNKLCFPNNTSVLIKTIGKNYSYSVIYNDSIASTTDDCKELVQYSYALLKGPEIQTIKVGTPYKDYGVLIIDKSGASIVGEGIIITNLATQTEVSSVNTSAPGRYKIQYYYSISNDNGTNVKNNISRIVEYVA